VFAVIRAGYGTSATLANWAIERLVHLLPDVLLRQRVTRRPGGSPALAELLAETSRDGKYIWCKACRCVGSHT
jgi:hypothetical protein